MIIAISVATLTIYLAASAAAAAAVAAAVLGHRARRAKLAAARIRLLALSAAAHAAAVAAAVFAGINGAGLVWVFAAAGNGLFVLLAVFYCRDAVKDAKTEAAKAKAAARPPRPLHQMTPLDYTPTKETNR